MGQTLGRQLRDSSVLCTRKGRAELCVEYGGYYPSANGYSDSHYSTQKLDICYSFYSLLYLQLANGEVYYIHFSGPKLQCKSTLNKLL